MAEKKQRKRRQFTPVFKAETAKLVLDGHRTVSQVVKKLDLTETAVRRWVQQARVDDGARRVGSRRRRARAASRCSR